MISWCYEEQSLQLRNDLLLLEPIPDHVNVDELPHIAAGLSIHQKLVEPAGYSYHRYLRMKSGIIEEVIEEVENSAEVEEEESRLRAEWVKKHGDKDHTDSENPNHYEVLELGHIGFNASDAQIKKAYQKMLLKYHPDKVMGGEGGSVDSDEEEEDPRFLAVQKAWEILGDPKRKRGYDSTFDFDESIPSGIEDFDEVTTFYNLYGPVFERNARFSEKKPVPLLGDETTSIEKVEKFYSFWNQFESWREFTKDDEHSPEDIETADSREEKRWMMRKNENKRAKQKKKEYERIRNLVERARKRDPRIIAHYKAQQEAKEAARRKRFEDKKAKEDAERLAKEQAEAAANAEENAKKEQEAAERKLRQNAKRAHKKAHKKLDKILEVAYKVISVSLAEREEIDGELHMLSEDTEVTKLIKEATTFFTGVDDEELSSDERIKIARSGIDAVRRAREAMKEGKTSMLSEEEQTAAEAAKEAAKAEAAAAAAKTEAVAPPEAAPVAEKEPEWSPKELSLLTKGVNKFPGGTRNRWDQIADYISSHYKEGEVEIRTKEQCIAKSKQLESGAAERHKMQSQHAHTEPDSPPAPTSETWTTAQQTQLEEALKKFPSSMEKNERWSAIAEAVEGKSKKECAARFKVLRESVMAKQQS